MLGELLTVGGDMPDRTDLPLTGLHFHLGSQMRDADPGSEQHWRRQLGDDGGDPSEPPALS